MAATAFAPALPAQRAPRLRSLSPHVLLVANANASGVVRHPEVVSAADRLLRNGGARVETRLTSTLEEFVALLEDGGRRVALLGGDGSLHAAANAGGAKPELALLPAGGANNVARSLRIPTDLADAARLALEGPARPLDLIAARTADARYLAVEGVSVGFHALARAQYHGRNSTDVVAGIRAGVGAAARFEPIPIAVDADGVSSVLKVSQLFVANMPFFGPGLHVAPGADPHDGVLDLVTIEDRGVGSLLGLVPHLRRGTHLGRKGVVRTSAERIRIATGGRSPVIADTTTLGAGTVELTVEPGALALVRGAR